MTRRSKILMIVVAALVIANVTVLGVLYFTNKGDDAQTTIVPEEDEERVARHIKSDLIQGKITKIDGGQIEYREIMDGTRSIPIDQQKTKTAKIDEETRMYAPCLLFNEYQASLDKEEAGETEGETTDQWSETNNEEGDFPAGGVDPEEKCPGLKEMLKIGITINFKVNDGKITYLSF